MAVHDVDVENSGSALNGGLRIFAETCEDRMEGASSIMGMCNSAAKQFRSPPGL
jgi:hypothetical protein